MVFALFLVNQAQSEFLYLSFVISPKEKGAYYFYYVFFRLCGENHLKDTYQILVRNENDIKRFLKSTDTY